MIVTFITAVVSILYSSTFEWLLHRYLMHRPFLIFDYPYDAHTRTHHHIFKADNTYHLIDKKDKWTIPMAWWNGPVLTIIATSPFVAVGFLLGYPIAIPMVALVVISGYYGTYEYIHWCMHLPKRRRVERSGIFFRLNGHHLLHHRYMHKNFNVVCPFADLCFGTLLRRSKLPFNQATGPSVPNVQPHTVI